MASPVALARAAARAASAAPGVVRLDGGPFNACATYGEGMKVAGVRVRLDGDPWVEVRVVLRFGSSIPAMGTDVRRRVAAALRAELDPRDVEPQVDVHVGDVESPGLGAAGPTPTRP